MRLRRKAARIQVNAEHCALFQVPFWGTPSDLRIARRTANRSGLNWTCSLRIEAAGWCPTTWGPRVSPTKLSLSIDELTAAGRLGNESGAVSAAASASLSVRCSSRPYFFDAKGSGVRWVSAHPHMAPATVASGAMNTPSFSSSSSSGGARIATHTQLTYSRQRLVALAKETIQVSKVGYYTNHKGEVRAPTIGVDFFLSSYHLV